MRGGFIKNNADLDTQNCADPDTQPFCRKQLIYTSVSALYSQDLVVFGSPRSRSAIIYWTPVLHSKQMDRVCTVQYHNTSVVVTRFDYKFLKKFNIL